LKDGPRICEWISGNAIFGQIQALGRVPLRDFAGLVPANHSLMVNRHNAWLEGFGVEPA
jgi:hypothetical protein